MDAIIWILILLTALNFLLKQTFRSWRGTVAAAVVAAGFVATMWPYAIEQSKSQVSVWLSDSALMLDAAVVLTLEVAVQMAFCILAAHIQTSGKVKPRTIWAYRILRWFPGVLIFPVLFSLLVTVIFALPGVPFPTVSWSLAGAVLVVLTGGIYGMKRLLPEKEIRLELLFLSNALIAVLGVIATVNGRTAVAGISKVEWPALAGVCVLLVIGLVGGTAIYRIRLKHIIKNK